MRRLLVAAAVLAVASVCSGIALAAVVLPYSGDGNTINGCYADNGDLLLLTPKMPTCPKKYVPIQWSVTGPQGTPGTNGVSPTVTQLSVGNANCPTGGAAITDANNSTAYVCNGQAGADGDPFSGTFTAGNYSISVTANGITLSGPNSRKIVLDNSGMTLDNGLSPVSIEGSGVSVDALQNVEIKALTFSAEAATTASLKGVVLTAEGSAVAELNGGIVKLGGSCAAGTPVAKVGSVVAGTTVVTGDLHTLVC